MSDETMHPNLSPRTFVRKLAGRTTDPTVNFRGKTKQSSGLWTLSNNVLAGGEEPLETCSADKSRSLLAHQDDVGLNRCE